MLRAALLANPVPSKYAGGAFAACIHACRPRKRGFLFLKNSGLRSMDLNLRWKTPVKPVTLSITPRGKPNGDPN